MQTAIDSDTLYAILHLAALGKDQDIPPAYREVVTHFDNYLRGAGYVPRTAGVDHHSDFDRDCRLFFPPPEAREELKWVSDFLVAHPPTFRRHPRSFSPHLLVAMLDTLYRQRWLDDVVCYSDHVRRCHTTALYRAVARNDVIPWRLAADLHTLFLVEREGYVDDGEEIQQSIHILYGLLQAHVDQGKPTSEQVETWFDSLRRHASSDLCVEVRSILARSESLVSIFHLHHYHDDLSCVESERAALRLLDLNRRLLERGATPIPLENSHLTPDFPAYAARIHAIPQRLQRIFDALAQVLSTD